jgi:hypothetical protein
MKKEFITSRIEATQDGSPYVYVTFSDPNDYKPGSDKKLNPFGANVMAFTSPEDLMKNLPKAMGDISKMISGNVGGVGGMAGDSPTFKISMRDYDDMNIKVGDKVTIDIKKSEYNSVYK